MDNLEYSNDALEIKGAFYNKDITIYVEGIDDPIFWHEALALVGKDAHIEEVNGCEELKKYISKILDEGAEFYVAIDRDHRDFVDSKDVQSNNILLTYGYSIENSIYKSGIINSIIVKYSRKPKIDVTDEVRKILDNFSKALEPLIIYDIANVTFNKGIKILGDSCARYLKHKNSLEISSEKVAAHISQLQESFTEEELNFIKSKINENAKPYWYLIKGHFISYLIINIIKYYTKKFRFKEVIISYEDLYTHTVDSIKIYTDDEDIVHLINEVNKVNYA